jgi:hypothetical protein
VLILGVGLTLILLIFWLLHRVSDYSASQQKQDGIHRNVLCIYSPPPHPPAPCSKNLTFIIGSHN